MLGQLGRLLSFTRDTRDNGAKVSDIKCNVGGSDNNLLVENFPPAGDDSFPLANDYVLLVPVKGVGRYNVCGYLDTKNTPKANAGDKRIYARNSAGDSIVELWLKNDGSAVLSNANGSLTLQASGDVVVNGATIDTSGNITSPGTITAQTIIGSSSVQAAGKELAGHDHKAGTPPGDTGPNQ